MKFLLDNTLGQVSVDNATYPVSLAGIASNVSYVSFDSVIGSGGIHYNDRPAVLEPVTDPTPYLTYINGWIAAAAAATPPLSLVQAQNIATRLAQAIFEIYLEAPVVYPIAGTPTTFDGTDRAVAYLAAQVGPMTSGSAMATYAAIKAAPVSFTIVAPAGTVNAMLASGLTVAISGQDAQGLLQFINNKRNILTANLASLLTTINAAASVAAVAAINLNSGWIISNVLITGPNPTFYTLGVPTVNAYFDSLGLALPNNATVTSIGLFSSGILSSPQIFIAQFISATSGNIVVANSVSPQHPGGGWFDWPLATPYVVPASGTYYTGISGASGSGTENLTTGHNAWSTATRTLGTHTFVNSANFGFVTRATYR